ncbi:DUF262 domain-containing protein [Candidatus Sulfurimonas baltica]|uniref:DUF262 domain-containing protein n=1 Tax=Candidatus Sulfurimonas baltica TaxID=2740404 RepID=A0A7S7LW04_9BACT|nr:DUF262 domain-containing protein [Candidatus Sulfurimonas baltica]QOY52486.1 DUF262 domain-containing protein [Candidatus Sulfurimonas baltica]
MNSRDIEEKFNYSQSSLVLQQSDLSLQSIADMVKNEAIDVSPKYQRRERWTTNKESSLIESFLLNIPVPPIYLAEAEYGKYSVIDGKQRVTAIYRFLYENLKLQNLDKFTELEGYTFNDLPAALSNALKIRPYLRVVTMLRQSNSELKHEVFLRLNKAGVALNAQEIRNVAFSGKFNDMLLMLSEIGYFKEQLNSDETTKMYKEMTDVQYVLRFFTLLNSWSNFPGNMDIAMDTFMATKLKSNDLSIEDEEHKFKSSLEFCETIWGDKGFKKPDGTSRVLQGYYDIQMVCSAMLTNEERINALSKAEHVKQALISKLETDEKFSKSLIEFTSNSKSVYYRIDEFYKILRDI